MNKLSEIFQAWVSAANPTPEQKLLAEQRTSVCDTCEHRSYNNTFNFTSSTNFANTACIFT